MPIEGLERVMKERIALGFGDNIDYEIVWDSKVIETLIIHYDIHNTELDINRGCQYANVIWLSRS